MTNIKLRYFLCKNHVENRGAKNCLAFKTEFTVTFTSTKT